MREARILAAVFAFALAILFVRQGLDFSLREMLPIVSGRPFDIYDAGALVMLFVTGRSLLRRHG